MPKAVVMFVFLHESKVDTVDLPEGHDWNNEHPSSHWGQFQTCNKCGIRICWDKINHKWLCYKRSLNNQKIPSCNEEIMNKALE